MKDLFVVKTDFNIFGVGIIQVSSLVFLLFLLWVFVKSSRNLTNDWLATEKVEKEQEISQAVKWCTITMRKRKKEKYVMGIAGGWYDVSCCIGRKTYSRRNFIPGDAFFSHAA